MRRVVVTGIGVLTSVGKDRETFFSNLLAARSGIKRISQFDPQPLNIQIAAEISDYDPAAYFPPKKLDLMDRFCQFCLVAAAEAMHESGLEPKEEERSRFGVVIGSGMGGVGTYEQCYYALYRQNVTRMHPFTVPKIMHNAPTSHLCMEYGAKGPALATSTACSSSSHAIGQAFHLIKFGMADMMLAGGADAPITYGMMRSWESMRVLATGNGDPTRACRPFSADREGLVIGEGAAVLVLEELEHAHRRGAKIYGEIAGYGMTADADHITHPTVEGPARAVEMAMREAEVNPSEVDYVNAHGTGTRLNDVVETRVLKQVFGEHARRLAVSSTKSMHGHTMGAGGAIELAACLLSLDRNVVPPTANLTRPDPECDLDYVPNQAREMPIRVVISNSFAFGGLNAVLLARQLE